MIDLAIIGGGPAGYVAAERAAQNGLNVVIFEKRELGGVCLNEGCIPTKTLLYSAKVYDTALGGTKYGVDASTATFDYKKMVDRKNKVVRKLVLGVAAKMKSHNVTVVKGEAMINGKNGELFNVSCGDDTFAARNILICTGSEAFIPPIEGLTQPSDTILTNREILAMKERPERIVIIGGGVIGIEFASLYNSLGSEVTVIEMLPEILTGNDSELSAMLREIYTKRGVKFILCSKVTRIDNTEVFYHNEEQSGSVVGDKILMSVGRRPVTTGFGLETLGLEMLRRGIEVDAQMRTSVNGVYAAGDVTGFSLLAHTASREAEVAVNDICGVEDEMRYDAIPAVVYTNPELSGVGLTEDEALKRDIDIKVLKLPLAYAGRFVAENEGGTGICKAIIGTDDRLLGLHILGNPSSEIICSAAMAIEQKMTFRQLQKVVFPHPTVSEIFKETMFE